MNTLSNIVNERSPSLNYFPLLILAMVMVVSLSFSPVRAQDVLTNEDTIEIDMGVLYDHIMSDPRNRKYLDREKKGWIKGPGSKSYFRFGGFIQANYIRDFQNTGYNFGEFIPGGIPVPREDAKNTEFDPRTSRVTFESQADTKKGVVSTFFSMDMSGMTQEGSVQPRLRQAYISWVSANSRNSLVFGQASTTFMDGYSWPELFDLEGPNAYLLIRQAMIRYSFMLSKGDAWVGAVSLEQPKSDIQNANGITGIPDAIFTANMDKNWGHIKFGVIGRQLIAENPSGGSNLSTLGYGALFSGTVNVPIRKDNFIWQLVAGPGTGRYVEDLGSTGNGEGAVYDITNNTLTPLVAFAGFAAYQHWWADELRTTVTYGYVGVDNQAIQGNDEFNQSTYVAANFIYSPFNNMDVGVEYYYGQRKNNNGDTGDANRLMFSVKYAF